MNLFIQVPASSSFIFVDCMQVQRGAWLALVTLVPFSMCKGSHSSSLGLSSEHSMNWDNQLSKVHVLVIFEPLANVQALS